MLRQALRWVHIASVTAYAGTVVLLLARGAAADTGSVEGFAATRQAMAAAADQVLIPALLLALTSGFLLLVARPLLIDARWVWAKAALGLAIGAVAFGVELPAGARATSHALQGSLGSTMSAVTRGAAVSRLGLDEALAVEFGGRGLNLALALAAVVIALRRPRFGQRSAAAAAAGGTASRAAGEPD